MPTVDQECAILQRRGAGAADDADMAQRDLAGGDADGR